MDGLGCLALSRGFRGANKEREKSRESASQRKVGELGVFDPCAASCGRENEAEAGMLVIVASSSFLYGVVASC